MGIKIVTGMTGEPHITSDDDRALNLGIFGKDSYVLPVGDILKLEMVDVNTARISCGDIVMKGCHARIPAGDYEEVSIDNGTNGYNRIDLIVAQYERNAGVESVTLQVIKGTPSTGTAVQPDYTSGSIYWGTTKDCFPLYSVTLAGINISGTTKLFTTIDARLSNIYNKSDIDTMKKAIDAHFHTLETAIDAHFNTLETAISTVYMTKNNTRKYIKENVIDVYNTNFSKNYENVLSLTKKNLDAIITDQDTQTINEMKALMESSTTVADVKTAVVNILNILGNISGSIDTSKYDTYSANFPEMTEIGVE